MFLLHKSRIDVKAFSLSFSLSSSLVFPLLLSFSLSLSLFSCLFFSISVSHTLSFSLSPFIFFFSFSLLVLPSSFLYFLSSLSF